MPNARRRRNNAEAGFDPVKILSCIRNAMLAVEYDFAGCAQSDSG